jgi:hypothetical protein
VVSAAQVPTRQKADRTFGAPPVRHRRVSLSQLKVTVIVRVQSRGSPPVPSPGEITMNARIRPVRKRQSWPNRSETLFRSSAHRDRTSQRSLRTPVLSKRVSLSVIRPPA